MNPPPKENEEELESFRRQWRAEVSARSKQAQYRPQELGGPSTVQRDRRKSTTVPVKAATAKRQDHNLEAEEIEPRVYHDLPDKELELRLGAAEQGNVRGASNREPITALEHYEKAVEKETQGSLGDSLRLYRTAFRLDDNVHEKYKNKHFPPSAFISKPQQPNPSNASATVPGTAHHSLHGLPPTISQLIEDFSQLTIPGAEPPTEASPPPPCPIAELPEELLIKILEHVAVADVASFSRVSRVCKRFAYLVTTEEQIWKRITMGTESGFGAMHYKYVCDIPGHALDPQDHGGLLEHDDVIDAESDDQDDTILDSATPPQPSFADITQHLLQSTYASSWRQMFRSRPRIRFNGCYISTVNYTRPGAASTTTTTWNAPIHIVTYFRYLRFFRDGSAISLLTTSEPGDVVHHLTRENLPSPQRTYQGSLLPQAVMKDALQGRWRLSGPGPGPGPSDNSTTSPSPEVEAEGDVHIETEGVVPKYMWRMRFALGSAGKGTRNNKLTWRGFWSYNRLTDDWGEFGLKNDRAYYWSRVKSYAD